MDCDRVVSIGDALALRWTFDPPALGRDRDRQRSMLLAHVFHS
ncbi:hypothetical protein NJ7G_0864 [Natrinema sp. J7-2]|nr:hypothetical protein NJ7G_0864 [Natrinema sp. J7-2]